MAHHVATAPGALLRPPVAEASSLRVPSPLPPPSRESSIAVAPGDEPTGSGATECAGHPPPPSDGRPPVSPWTAFGPLGADEPPAPSPPPSQVTITSKTPSSQVAYKAKYSDGRLVPGGPGQSADPKPCAGVTGTTIVVRNRWVGWTPDGIGAQCPRVMRRGGG